MKKNLVCFGLMCIGACAIDSEGWAFVLACLLVGVPAIIFIVGELFNQSNNVSADICEDVLVDYATRSDMNWEGGLI
jgi:hypothetical protein